MKISIQSLLEGARNASGVVAVIDTFRIARQSLLSRT
jgi:hypothetical protein